MCIFCKIVSGELPSFKIYEDEKFLAFLDRSQFAEGHTLVIPKKHFDFVWDVENFEEYWATAKFIAESFRKKLGFKFVDTLTLGRMINHAHIHLIPHNGEIADWQNVIETVGKLQSVPKSQQFLEKVYQKFKLS